MSERLAEHHHVPPPLGEPQPLSNAPVSPEGRHLSQGGGGGGFVTVNQRLFAPLQGLDPANVLQGGYGWLDATDGGMTYHPGLDLNAGGSCGADAGNAVVSPLAGVVRATLWWDGYTPGEGNHLYIELDDPCCPAPTYVHFDHLLVIDVVVGQRVMPGQPVGACGKSGGWDCEHLHTELLKSSPQYGWYQWPFGWSKAQVEAAYHNPTDWWNASSALVLAEGGHPIPPQPPEVAMILTGAQQAAVQAAVWGEYWNPDMADFALPTAWREEWKAGRWRGQPISTEQDIPASEDKPAGKFQLFTGGCACWLQDQPVSWNG